MKPAIEKAMVLAAGFGTRLLPLTENMPKALVEVKGNPMIKYVIDKLVSFGIREIVVNVHHHADKMVKYFETTEFGAKIIIINEEIILGTGGGIKNAKELLEDSESFLVYNADISSEIDLRAMANAHFKNNCIATLAVHKRKTTRPLLFDQAGMLAGRKKDDKSFIYLKSAGELTEMAFCGIHIISSAIFETFPDTPAFDIVLHYMELIKSDHKIKAFDIGSTQWKDLGKYSDFK